MHNKNRHDFTVHTPLGGGCRNFGTPVGEGCGFSRPSPFRSMFVTHHVKRHAQGEFSDYAKRETVRGEGTNPDSGLVWASILVERGGRQTPTPARAPAFAISRGWARAGASKLRASGSHKIHASAVERILLPAPRPPPLAALGALARRARRSLAAPSPRRALARPRSPRYAPRVRGKGRAREDATDLAPRRFSRIAAEAGSAPL